MLLTDVGELAGSSSHENGADEEEDDIGLESPLATDLFSDCSRRVWLAVWSQYGTGDERDIRRKQMMAPKKAPAWKVDVMLDEMSAECSGLMLKSVLKLCRAMVVPTKAES